VVRRPREAAVLRRDVAGVRAEEVRFDEARDPPVRADDERDDCAPVRERPVRAGAFFCDRPAVIGVPSLVSVASAHRGCDEERVLFGA
jgi:hypothetical protein